MNQAVDKPEQIQRDIQSRAEHSLAIFEKAFLRHESVRFLNIRKEANPTARGFTLVEVMIALGIMAVLTVAAMGYASNSFSQRARDDARKDLVIVTGSVKSYAEEKASLPATLTELQNSGHVQRMGVDYSHLRYSVVGSYATLYSRILKDTTYIIPPRLQ